MGAGSQPKADKAIGSVGVLTGLVGGVHVLSTLGGIYGAPPHGCGVLEAPSRMNTITSGYLSSWNDTTYSISNKHTTYSDG